MRNYKKESNHSMNEGFSNKNTVNVLNPDGQFLVLKGKEWMNPNQPDYNKNHKVSVKSIIQINKEAVQKKKAEKAIEGK